MLPKVLQLQDKGAQYVFSLMHSANLLCHFVELTYRSLKQNPLSWTNVMAQIDLVHGDI